MRVIEQYKKTVRFAAIFVLALFVTAAYGLVWYYKYNINFENPYIGKGIVFTFFAYFAIFVFISFILKVHKIDEQLMGEIVFNSIIAVAFSNVVAYVQISLIDAKLANPLPLFGLLAVQCIVAAIWASLGVTIIKHLRSPERMIIVYGSHSAEDLVVKMSKMEDKYRICEAIKTSEGVEAVIEAISRYESVIICDAPAQERNDILKFCYENSKKIYIVPKISDVIIRGASDITYFDSPLVYCASAGLTVEQRYIKRIFDVCVSFLGLVILSPVFLLVSIAIKLCDGGPVFYKQERMTADEKHFQILKFRSMIVDAEKEGVPIPAVNEDKRITPVGKFIRKIRIDELPQLINILRGDMSVVGPRPERIEHVEQYAEKMPEFLYRYKVKGGLTGYAQVFGKYNTTAYNKLKLDLMYIQNYSFVLDMKLILMTARILFDKDSTDGFAEKKDSDKRK